MHRSFIVPAGENTNENTTSNMATHTANLKDDNSSSYSPHRNLGSTRGIVSISLGSHLLSTNFTDDFEGKCREEADDLMFCELAYGITSHKSRCGLEDKNHEDDDGMCDHQMQIDASNKSTFRFVHFPKDCIHQVREYENECHDNILKAAVIEENDRLNREVDEIFQLDSLFRVDESWWSLSSDLEASVGETFP